MNRDDVIRMAREAGKHQWPLEPEFLERFAALVVAEIGIAQHRRGYESGLRDGAAAEREACAKVCEEVGEESDWFTQGILRGTAAVIRARGQA